MLNLINHTQLPTLTDKVLTNIQAEAIKILNFLANKNQRDWGEINLLFCGKKEIQKLNSDFLNKDYPTDVLTFNDDSDDQDSQISGDVALCLSVVFDNATTSSQLKLSKEYVFFETVLHGFLHLYGLTHDYEAATLQSLYDEQHQLLKQIKPNYSLITHL